MYVLLRDRIVRTVSGKPFLIEAQRSPFSKWHPKTANSSSATPERAAVATMNIREISSSSPRLYTALELASHPSVAWKLASFCSDEYGLILSFGLPHDVHVAEKCVPDVTMCMLDLGFHSSSSIPSMSWYNWCGIIFVACSVVCFA